MQGYVRRTRGAAAARALPPHARRGAAYLWFCGDLLCPLQLAHIMGRGPSASVTSHVAAGKTNVAAQLGFHGIHKPILIDSCPIMVKKAIRADAERLSATEGATFT